MRDLGRIKNIFHLLFISLVILTRLGEFLYTLAEGLSQLLKKLPSLALKGIL